MLLRMHLQMLVLTDFPIANGIALVVPLDIADQSKSIFEIRLQISNERIILLLSFPFVLKLLYTDESN